MTTADRSRPARWIRAIEPDEVRAVDDGAARVVRLGGPPIAVFRAAGDFYAVDNRCPHEGYPLAKGNVVDCVVTCKWHNYKFDLRDGACVMGDEAVRTFPIRRAADGALEIDVAEPPFEVERARLLASLEEGLLARRLGQVARDVVRLILLGVSPVELAAVAARFDAARAEYGTTHVLPVAVDSLALAARAEGAAAALPLMQAFELAAESHARRPSRPTPAPRDPGDDAAAAGARLRELVEREELGEAEALLRGAVRRGWGREVVEPWLYQLVCDHFLDFGHALIYQVKVFDLVDAAGWDEHAEELLAAHLHGIGCGTREDTLPEWQHFEIRWREVAPRAAALWERACAGGDAPPPALVERIALGDRDAAFDAVIAALEGGVSPQAIASAIALGGAERCLRFDVAHDADPTLQNDWLDVTHALTTGNALRHAARRFRDPAMVRALLFGARLVQVTSALDAPAERQPSRAPRPGATPDDVISLARRRDQAAVGAAAACLERGEDEALSRALEALILDDPVVRPIVAGHLVKVARAAFEERAATGDPRPPLALVRLVASPIRERRVGRLTHEAIRFVVDGKVPRSLY